MTGLRLKVFGPLILRDTLKICQKIGLKPFLTWGTLLGCVRDGEFISHDQDVDLGLLRNDYAKRKLLKKEMLQNGYGIRCDSEHIISFYHLKCGGLWVDFYLMFERGDEMVTVMQDKKERKSYVYSFPKAIFSDFKFAVFKELEVLVPSKFKEFLRVAYGDWRTPKIRTSHIYDYENLTVESYPFKESLQ